jgi:putative tryptophan/tyrosine transport system substrate-binding protein
MKPAMERRTFLGMIAGGLLAAPFDAEAQPVGKVHRIGFIGNSTAASSPTSWHRGVRVFVNLATSRAEISSSNIDGRKGDYNRLPALVAELIALKVDVLVTARTPAALAVKRATKTIPLVMVAVGDPVGTGLVASLARPGGNLTGLAWIAPDLEGKRLELLREVVPKRSHVTVLTNPANPFHAISEKQLRAAAGVLQIKVQFVGVRAEPELDHAFEVIMRDRPGGLIVLADRVFLHHRVRVAEFATRNPMEQPW